MPVNNGTDNTLRITVVSRLRTALRIDQLNLLEKVTGSIFISRHNRSSSPVSLPGEGTRPWRLAILKPSGPLGRECRHECPNSRPRAMAWAKE